MSLVTLFLLNSKLENYIRKEIYRGFAKKDKVDNFVQFETCLPTHPCDGKVLFSLVCICPQEGEGASQRGEVPCLAAQSGQGTPPYPSLPSQHRGTPPYSLARTGVPFPLLPSSFPLHTPSSARTGYPPSSPAPSSWNRTEFPSFAFSSLRSPSQYRVLLTPLLFPPLCPSPSWPGHRMVVKNKWYASCLLLFLYF